MISLRVTTALATGCMAVGPDHETPDVVCGLVALYRALGGAWDPDLEPVAPEPAGRVAALAGEEDAS